MSLQVTVIGGGMIVHDQILPSLYQLQRLQVVTDIQIVATSSAHIPHLRSERFTSAFTGHSFTSIPDATADPAHRDPDRYRAVVEQMAPSQLVVVATPDPLHFDMVRWALEHDQHVLCVKPLVQSYAQAMTLAQLARERGLYVGVEYHKRFDRRALEARRHYRQGRFGEFRIGEARLIEPYYYRHSNFQNWFTKENSDPFTYIGCHYVDQIWFITGLRPVEVRVRGVEGDFPNGKRAYLWSSGQVIFENGAILHTLNGLGYPDEGAGSNDQGITLYCEDRVRGGLIKHNDQYRGVDHGYVDSQAGVHYRFINPDYFRLVPWPGTGLRPVGYGYDSIEAHIRAADELPRELGARRQRLAEIDAHGILATPHNSSINELVVEAARASIQCDGLPVRISYDPQPHVVAIP